MNEGYRPPSAEPRKGRRIRSLESVWQFTKPGMTQQNEKLLFAQVRKFGLAGIFVLTLQATGSIPINRDFHNGL